MAEDSTLIEINTQQLDSDLNANFAALEDGVNTIALNLSAFETATLSALSYKADDTAVVHLAGDEVISGVKTFSSPIVGSGENLTGTKASSINSDNTFIRMATNQGGGRQSTVAGVITKIATFASDVDVKSEFNATTQKIVIQNPGIYQIQVKFAPQYPDTLSTYLYCNGVSLSQANHVTTRTDETVLNFTASLLNFAGCELEFYVKTNTNNAVQTVVNVFRTV